MSDATLTLLVLGLMTAGFFTQVIPTYVVALTGALALAFLGVIPMSAFYGGLANPTLVLFAAMFVIGSTLFHTGLAQLLGTWVVRRSGGSPRRLLWGIMATTMAVSTFASNTGTAAALVPVILSVSHTAGLPASRILMPMAFTTGFAGFSTLVGTPPNLIVSEALRLGGHRPLEFFEFAWICLPMAVAGMLYMDLAGRRLLPEGREAPPAETPQLQGWAVPVGRLRMWVSGLILVTVAGAMVANSPALPMEAAALAGALLCVITGCIGRKQALASIDWETILLFGAMFAVAAAVDGSGAGLRIAEAVLAALGPRPPAWLLLGSLFLLGTLLGTVLSNTACAALLAPIGLGLAQATGADPHALLVTIAASASCSFLAPMSTPPNALVMVPGGYHFRDYPRVGAGLTAVCLAVALAVIPLRWPVYP